MNPDGWRRAEEGDCGGQDFYAGRLNYNRVALNRIIVTTNNTP